MKERGVAKGRQITSLALHRVHRAINRFGWSLIAMFAVLIVGKGALDRVVDSVRAFPTNGNETSVAARPISATVEVQPTIQPIPEPKTAEQVEVQAGISGAPTQSSARSSNEERRPSEERGVERKDARTGTGRKLSEDWTSTN